MLPRVAPTTGVLQPSLALPASTPVDAAVKPQLSAAALANLKAEVLLRLIETLLKHMPRTGEPNANRDLLETILTVLKTLPGREGESGRKLADLIAKLPPELRPSVEKLIGAVLSTMPTRSLIEIVRNPSGPEAQKLATLLATNLNLGEDGDLPAAGPERQQRPLGLTAQQLAAVISRHGTPQTAQATQMASSDARALQTALKRIFDVDGNSKPRVATGRTLEVAEARQVLSAMTRLPAETSAGARTEPRLPTPIVRPADQPPVEATAATPRHDGNGEETEAATPAVKREEVPAKAQITNAAGQALARSVLQAVARDMSPALLTQAVAHLVENLSPEEANFLRAILERPLDPATEQALAVVGIDEPEEAAQQSTETGTETGTETETASDVIKQRPDTAQPASTTPRQIAEQTAPMPQPREGAPPAVLTDTTPDILLPVIVVPREGVPLAFVPYLPAEEDLEWKEPAQAEQDEEADEDQADGEDERGSEAGADSDPDASDAEPETADMVRRREKTAEMVGVIEPGLAFYQKLGDYWT